MNMTILAAEYGLQFSFLFIALGIHRPDLTVYPGQVPQPVVSSLCVRDSDPIVQYHRDEFA